MGILSEGVGSVVGLDLSLEVESLVGCRWRWTAGVESAVGDGIGAGVLVGMNWACRHRSKRMGQFRYFPAHFGLCRKTPPRT